MKTSNVMVVCGGLALAVSASIVRPLVAGQGAPPNAPISPKTTVALFNGKDLSNFYTWTRDTKYENPRKIFNIEKENGQPVLHITGDGYGGLITKTEYTNYHLIAEYRWGDRTWGDRVDLARDNGILIHGIGPDGGSTVMRVAGVSPWLTSFEFQIIEGGVGDFLVLAGNDATEQPLTIGATVEVEMRPVPSARGGTTDQPFWKKGGEPKRIARGGATRVNWANKDPNVTTAKGTRGAKDVDTPGHGWTRVEYIADGDKLTYIVNGVVVMEASNITPTAGKIQVQTEQAEIYYRKIELHPLKK
jgi:3-keto-disaccharide hydrolase